MTPLAASLLEGNTGAKWAGESSPQCPVLVLAMGNILLEDEGLGIHALKQLQQRFKLSTRVELLDGGTSGMSLIDDISGREHLLVLDACQTGDPPGTLVILKDEEVPVYFSQKATLHQLGLADVLAHLKLTNEQPGHVTVLGLVPASLELSLDLSKQVQSRLGKLVDATVAELRALQCVEERQARSNE